MRSITRIVAVLALLGGGCRAHSPGSLRSGPVRAGSAAATVTTGGTAATAVGGAGAAGGAATTTTATVAPGTAIPAALNWKAPAVAGGQVVGANYTGKAVALWFWAPW